jgi:hypothetical protein
MESLPEAPPLRLADGAFRAALRCCLGESNLLLSTPEVVRFYGMRLLATDSEHALRRHSHNALHVT